MSFRLFMHGIRAALPVAAICGLFAAGTNAVGQSNLEEMQNRSCSNRTLSGDYGAQIVGTLIGPNFTIRGLLMMHFDGRGNLTAKSHVVLNGTPEDPGWIPNSGTYEVSPDCTGSALISTAQPPIPLHFVIVNNGKEIDNVVDGDAITVVAYRVR